MRDAFLGEVVGVTRTTYRHPGPADARWVAQLMAYVWADHDRDVMSEAEHATYDAQVERCAPTTSDCDDACEMRRFRCESEVRRSIMSAPDSSRSDYAVELTARRLASGSEFTISHPQLCGGPAAETCEPTHRRLLFDDEGTLLSVYDSAQGTNSKAEEYYVCDSGVGGGAHGIDLRGCLELARDFMPDQRTQVLSWRSSSSAPPSEVTAMLSAGLQRFGADGGAEAGPHSITQWTARDSGRTAATVTIGESTYDLVLTDRGPRPVFDTRRSERDESDEGPTRFSCLYGP